MKDYKILDVDGDEILTVETNQDVNQQSDRVITIGATSLKFEDSVSIDAGLPEDYTEEFVICIDSELEDAIVDSLGERGVSYEDARSIAMAIGGTEVTVEVEIMPSTEEVEVTRVDQY